LTSCSFTAQLRRD